MLEQFFRNDTKIVIDPSSSFEFLNLDHSIKCDERFTSQTAIQDIESIVELDVQPKSELTTEILQANDTSNNLCLETVNDESNFEFNVYEDEVCSSNDVTFDEDEDVSDGNANNTRLECDQCGKHYKREVTI